MPLWDRLWGKKEKSRTQAEDATESADSKAETFSTERETPPSIQVSFNADQVLESSSSEPRLSPQVNQSPLPDLSGADRTPEGGRGVVTTGQIERVENVTPHQPQNEGDEQASEREPPSADGVKFRLYQADAEHEDEDYEPPETMMAPRDQPQQVQTQLSEIPSSLSFGAEPFSIASTPPPSSSELPRVFLEQSVFRPLEENERYQVPALDDRGVEPLLVPSLLEVASLYRQWVEQFSESQDQGQVSQMWVAYLELCPDDFESLVAYGWHLFEHQGPEQAWPLFAHVLEQQSESVDAFVTAGRFWMRANQPLRAVPFFEDATRLAPRRRDLLLFLLDAQKRAQLDDAVLLTEGQIQALDHEEGAP
ncbi:MAG: hypothetical protein VYD19_05375 [Myxococcota bacterium]|nr:hypothetical protein [Myxococcota bacterium]